MNSKIIASWKHKEAVALGQDNSVKVLQQIHAGKKTARQRIEQLLDHDSFEEIDRLVTSPFLCDKLYTDGVVTGFGTIDGKKVALYAQDFTLKGGSLGKKHAEKICKIMDLAAKVGCPIIGLIDSGGARIDEGIHALAGYGSIFMRNVRYSGVIPQISLILGPCAGGAAYSPALTDFVFMVEKNSQLFITGPQVIEQVLGQTVTKDDLGGSAVHMQKSGVAHFLSTSEDDCFVQLKNLLRLIPHHYLDTSKQHFNDDEAVFIKCDSINKIVPAVSNKVYDMLQVIENIFDSDTFFEIQDSFANNIIIGLAHLCGVTVGVIANQPQIKAGTIDIDASVKAARFIQYCNSFSIPIISLVDVPGYLPGIDQEHSGIIRHGAKLLYAYAQATVPKITVIIRKAFGGAYIVMGSKELGADFNFAWPEAQIAVLGASAAVKILHGKLLAQENTEHKEIFIKDLEKEYEEEFLNPFIAAEHGYIDAIIEPEKTREHLVRALAICLDKVETLPKKKQGNMPL